MKIQFTSILTFMQYLQLQQRKIKYVISLIHLLIKNYQSHFHKFLTTIIFEFNFPNYLFLSTINQVKPSPRVNNNFQHQVQQQPQSIVQQQKPSPLRKDLPNNPQGTLKYNNLMGATAGSSKGLGTQQTQHAHPSQLQQKGVPISQGNQLKQNININNKKPVVQGVNANQLNISNISKQSTNMMGKHIQNVAVPHQFKQDSRSPPKFFASQNPGTHQMSQQQQLQSSKLAQGFATNAIGASGNPHLKQYGVVANNGNHYQMTCSTNRVQIEDSQSDHPSSSNQTSLSSLRS